MQNAKIVFYERNNLTWLKKKLTWLFQDTLKMWKADVALWWYSIQYEKKKYA